MGAEFKTNDSRELSAPIDVTLEQDQGYFLSIQCDELGLDLYCNTPSEVDYFFEQVEEAHKAWLAR